MALNSAFENVYHVDDSGNHTFYTRLPGAIRPAVSNKPFPGVNYSGMLMSPFTGTGKPQDPLVSSNTRKETIKKALKPTGIGEAKILSHKDETAISPGKEEDMNKVLGTVHHSGIPTHTIDQLNINETRVGHTINLRTWRKNNTSVLGNYTPASRSLRITPDSDDTVIHELGHARDPHLHSYTGHSEHDTQEAYRLGKTTPTAFHKIGGVEAGSPIEEGKADGFTDRYSDPMRYESSLRPHQDYRPEHPRYRDESSQRSSHPLNKPDDPSTRSMELKFGGYGAEGSGWKTSLERAVYVASRAHAALSHDPENGMPELHHMVAPEGTIEPMKIEGKKSFGMRESQIPTYRSSGKRAQEMWLGYMVHHHPHVREALKSVGTVTSGRSPANLHEIGEKARTKYLNAQTDAVHEHPTLGPKNFWKM